MGLQLVGYGGMDWIALAQVAGSCEWGIEPSGSINLGNLLTSCKPVSFSRKTLLHGVSKYFFRPRGTKKKLGLGYITRNLECG